MINPLDFVVAIMTLVLLGGAAWWFWKEFFLRKTREISQEDREIQNHIDLVSIRLSIEKEAEQKFNEVWNKLTDKEKKKVDKVKPPMMFLRRSDYLDWKRYLCEDILESRGKKK